MLACRLVAAGLVPLLLSATALGAGSAKLTIAWEAEPRSLDPRYAIDANSQYLENLINCSLIDFDADGRTIPGLAKDWRWLNPTTLELTLNTAAKFSDASAVTAADAKATYDFFKRTDVKNPSPRKGAFAKIKAITAKADKLSFELEEPDSTLVSNLVIGILPARLAAKEMLSDTDGLIGCGPFQFKALNPNGLELTANEHYSLGAPPKTKNIAIKFVKDEATRWAKLSSGEVDIVQNGISRDKVTTLTQTNPNLMVLKRAGQQTTYLGFNMKDKLVGNAKVRQAIAHAIDRDKLIRYALNGLATPATTLITAADPFFDKTIKSPSYDTALAQKLLDEAGFPAKGGKRLAISYKTTTDLTRIQIAKQIAADLRKVGIDVTVESLEWGRFKADVEAGKVQMWSLAWVGFKDPDIYRFAFASDAAPPNGGNRGWYANPALDKLMAEARTTTDAKLRAADYQKVQKIVSDDLPYVFLWHEDVFAIVNKSVKDFDVYADGRYGALTKAYKQ